MAVTSAVNVSGLYKTPTGIRGLDDITDGGLPGGRTTLIAGPAGSGKTLLGIEFLVHGALEYGEPGVLLAFEESEKDLAANVASLGFDLPRLQADGLLAVDAFRVDPALLVEAGEYDLEGLFLRLGLAVDAVGAKRVVLDSLEVLFGALGDAATVRAEFTRLFGWLKERNLTAIVTSEQGEGSITRHGIEEYVSDCVITLDHRVHEQVSTRRMRVVKYRGSVHGTNEVPFLITEGGMLVLPGTSAKDHDASLERLLTGVPRLDHMLGGGIYRGSTVLINGEVGTGKTTLAAKMIEATCGRGERAVFVTSEESPAQLMRNMSSVNIDLKRWMDQGLLRLWAYGLEMHRASLLRQVEEFQPTMVALDSMVSGSVGGVSSDVTSLFIREIDHLKSQGVTTVLTSSTHPDRRDLSGLSSLADTWLVIRNVQTNGEHNPLLSVMKSRGSAHSRQVREFIHSSSGLELLDVSVGANGVVVGSARLALDAENRASSEHRAEATQRRHEALVQRRAEAVAQVAALHARLDAEEVEAQRLDTEEERRQRAESGEVTSDHHGGADAPPRAGMNGSRS